MSLADMFIYEAATGSKPGTAQRADMSLGDMLIYDAIKGDESQLRQAIDELAGENRYLKGYVAGLKEIEAALQRALAEVAPTHPMVNPLIDNPVLNEIGAHAYEQARARAR